MIYRRFRLERFRGVDDVSVSLVKGDLVLLLGLNESGKTTILRGIEAFDYRNDPVASSRQAFWASVRNKSDLYSSAPAIVSAELSLDGGLSPRKMSRALKDISPEAVALVEAFAQQLADSGAINISRVFPFQNGKAQVPYYSIETNHPIRDDQRLLDRVGRHLIDMCPFIIYFEDFTDRIPDRIFVTPSNDAFNEDWYDIIDGLFFNTDSDYSVSAFKALHRGRRQRLDDAKTVLKRVNKTLNQVFTRKWEKLSGVSDIEDTELIYRTARSPYLEIKISDTDGTTYSVEERSKGALWYLSFLMKTEFRRKKIRKGSGKPIFLIDEPASNLHSTAQQNMLDDFRTLVEDTAIIYTTHSQYLVGVDNIKNTYVIRRDKGTVSATLWSDYLREKEPVVSHYQPLANLLQLVPNSLDVPWPRAIITEGPSDRSILMVMHRVTGSPLTDHVIYPGTNAFNLGSLISLNLGWGADFRVLLDSDAAGQEAADRYQREFDLPEETIVMLPRETKKIEKLFSDDERRALFSLALGQPKPAKVSKGQFRAAMAALCMGKGTDTDVKKLLSSDTIERFEELFRRLDF